MLSTAWAETNLGAMVQFGANLSPVSALTAVGGESLGLIRQDCEREPHYRSRCDAQSNSRVAYRGVEVVRLSFRLRFTPRHGFSFCSPSCRSQETLLASLRVLCKRPHVQ
jgi:hypothetical protein